MPKKKGTQEKFTVITVEQSTADMVRKHKRPNEPIYQTWRRVICIYNESELPDAQFMLKQYEEHMKRQKEEIDKLKLERRNYLVWTGQNG